MNFVSVNVRSKSHPHLALQLAVHTVVEKFYRGTSAWAGVRP